MFKMLIGSDLVPTETNYDLFEAGNVNELVGERLKNELESADFRIFNLETPVYDGQAPITKCGPNLIVPTRTMPGIKALNPSLMALANNHILDHGEDGLYSTFAELEKWNIPYIGAGHNLSEAQKPYIIEANGKKLGIYNCAEHEFTIAEENKGGANPFDPFESLDHIAELKEECDFVIVLYHGGKEHYRYPTPRLKKVCRKIAQKGADLVVCQHSHCVGCMEEYNGSTIVYGQGNFLFDHSKSEFWQTSLLINAEFEEDMHISFVPICKNDYVVRYAPDKDASYNWTDYTDIINTILTSLITNGKGIEINTSGLTKGLRSANPCLGIVKRYRELGGEIITIGSDAHCPAHIASSFNTAIDMLTEAGFKYYTRFIKRKPDFISL